MPRDWRVQREGAGGRTCDPQATVRTPRWTARPRQGWHSLRGLASTSASASGHKEMGGGGGAGHHHCSVLPPRLPPLPHGGPFLAAGGPGLTTMWSISGQGWGMDGVLFISRGLNNGAVGPTSCGTGKPQARPRKREQRKEGIRQPRAGSQPLPPDPIPSPESWQAHLCVGRAHPTSLHSQPLPLPPGAAV